MSGCTELGSRLQFVRVLCVTVRECVCVCVCVLCALCVLCMSVRLHGPRGQAEVCVGHVNLVIPTPTPPSPPPSGIL